MEDISDFLKEEPDTIRQSIPGAEGWQDVVFTVGDPEEKERESGG